MGCASLVFHGTPREMWGYPWTEREDGVSCGAWSVIAVDSHAPDSQARREAARRRFEEIQAGLPELAVVGELAQLWKEAATLGAKLSDELENLTLRRYVPGACQWCPGGRLR